MGFIVTANALLDGSPRYLIDEARWAETLKEARIYPTKQEAESHRDGARDQEDLICDPFVAKVTLQDGVAHPIGQRYEIRSAGASAVLDRLGYGAAAQGGS